MSCIVLCIVSKFIEAWSRKSLKKEYVFLRADLIKRDVSSQVALYLRCRSSQSFVSYVVLMDSKLT